MKKFTIGIAVLAVAGLVGYMSTAAILNKNTSLTAQSSSIYANTSEMVDQSQRLDESQLAALIQKKTGLNNETVQVLVNNIKWQGDWNPSTGEWYVKGSFYLEDLDKSDRNCRVETNRLKGIETQLSQIAQKPKTPATEKVRLSLEKDKKEAEKALALCKKKNGIK